jgi:glycosyltransferase involved in cell wall biosynthesis
VPHDVNQIAEALAAVLDHPERHATLVARGMAQVRLFTWEQCAQQVLVTLEQVSGAGGAACP